MKRRHKESVILKAALKIVQIIRNRQKETEITILFRDEVGKVDINCRNERIGWDVLEEIPDATPKITWEVRKNDEDDLVISLINEEEETV